MSVFLTNRGKISGPKKKSENSFGDLSCIEHVYTVHNV